MLMFLPLLHTGSGGGSKAKGDNCELPPPSATFCTNSGGGPAVAWTPVPGATGYMIEFRQNDRGCACRGGSTITTYVNVGLVTSYASLPSNCFSWRVASICPDGSGGVFSPQKCFKAGVTPCF